MKRLLLAATLAATAFVTTTPAKAACVGDGTYSAAEVFGADFCVNSSDFTFDEFERSSENPSAFEPWSFTFDFGAFDITQVDANSQGAEGVYPGVPSPVDPSILDPNVFYGYKLIINDITKQIGSVSLDTTGAFDDRNGGENDYGAVKTISTQAYSDEDFLSSVIQSVFVVESIDGDNAAATPAEIAALANVSEIYVRDYLQTQGSAFITGATNSYTVEGRTNRVPAPLGLAGVMGTFAWARRMRRRIKAA